MIFNATDPEKFTKSDFFEIESVLQMIKGLYLGSATWKFFYHFTSVKFRDDFWNIIPKIRIKIWPTWHTLIIFQSNMLQQNGWLKILTFMRVNKATISEIFLNRHFIRGIQWFSNFKVFRERWYLMKGVYFSKCILLVRWTLYGGSEKIG